MTPQIILVSITYYKNIAKVCRLCKKSLQDNMFVKLNVYEKSTFVTLNH